MIKVEQIKETIKKHDAYLEVLKWNNKLNNDESIEWILGKIFAGYQDDELMVIGIINKIYTDENEVKALLSLFKNPRLTDEKLQQEVLKQMTQYAKDVMEVDRVAIVPTKISNKDDNKNKSIIKSLRNRKSDKKGV